MAEHRQRDGWAVGSQKVPLEPPVAWAHFKEGDGSLVGALKLASYVPFPLRLSPDYHMVFRIIYLGFWCFVLFLFLRIRQPTNRNLRSCISGAANAWSGTKCTQVGT